LPFHQASAAIIWHLIYLAQPLKNFQPQPYRISVTQSNFAIGASSKID